MEKRTTRVICLILSFILMVLTAVGCGSGNDDAKNGTQDSGIPAASDAEIAELDKLYAGRKAYFGDMHVHPYAGGDGKTPLADWKEQMVNLELDFVAPMIHRQIYHMYVSDWDDTMFIGGSEPSTSITDSGAVNKSMHYNIIIPDPTDLRELMDEFPEYNYAGSANGTLGGEDSFSAPSFTTARFKELIKAIQAKGGLFVHVHPMQLMQSSNILDYYFADYTGLEVFYSHEDNSIAGQDTVDNYDLWTELLAKGKRIWATAGSDSHHDAEATALTCIYSDAKKDDNYVSYLSKGDFVCGGVGIRMAIGDAKMGSSTDFDGKKVLLSVGDFHSSLYKEGKEYIVNVITDKGVVYTTTIDGSETAYFSFDADEQVAFYRVEVIDEEIALQPIIAIGNPIWND